MIGVYLKRKSVNQMKSGLKLVNIVLAIILVFGLVGCKNNQLVKEETVIDQTVIEDDVVVNAPESIKDETDNNETTLLSETDNNETTLLSETEIESIELNQWIEKTIEGMSLEDKVAQMFYVSYETYLEKERTYGGIIFFKDHLRTIESTKSMIKDIKSKAKIPYFYGIDEEGGIVTRISGEGSLGGTSVPNAWDLSHLKHPLAVYLANKVIASEISVLGFNMNFAPVADIHSNPNNPIIGHRAYSDNPDIVAKAVLQAIHAYEEYKVIPVVKHFPGHGDTSADSHTGSVLVSHDIDRLKSVELIPFEGAIEEGISVIMMGHILLPKLTTVVVPASLSVEIIDDLLRQELGYKGIVISDALNMKAITKDYATSQVIDLGLEAGLDQFLMPDDTREAYNYLLGKAQSSKVVEDRINESLRRILEVKYRYGLFADGELDADSSIIGSEKNKQQIRTIQD